MDKKELARLDKLPYQEQKEITDKRIGYEKRRAFIRASQDEGKKVMAVKNIKEAIEAKQYLERNGNRDVKIVGGTNKPIVIFE